MIVKNNNSIEGKRRLKAFSLIELLVVIAIIGILASLIAPSLGSARNRAQLATCKSNLKQLGVFAFSFESSAGYLPLGATDNANAPTWQNNIIWDIYRQGITCPSQRYKIVPAGQVAKGYGTNPQVMPFIYNLADLTPSRKPVSTDEVTRPHEVIMMADVAMWDSRKNGYHSAMAHYISPGAAAGREVNANNPVAETVIRWNGGNHWGDDPLMPRRHDGEAAIVYVDGHVGTIRDYSEVKNRNYFAYFND